MHDVPNMWIAGHENKSMEQLNRFEIKVKQVRECLHRGEPVKLNVDSKIVFMFSESEKNPHYHPNVKCIVQIEECQPLNHFLPKVIFQEIISVSKKEYPAVVLLNSASGDAAKDVMHTIFWNEIVIPAVENRKPNYFQIPTDEPPKPHWLKQYLPDYYKEVERMVIKQREQEVREVLNT